MYLDKVQLHYFYAILDVRLYIGTHDLDFMNRFMLQFELTLCLDIETWDSCPSTVCHAKTFAALSNFNPFASTIIITQPKPTRNTYTLDPFNTFEVSCPDPFFSMNTRTIYCCYSGRRRYCIVVQLKDLSFCIL
jgi:hypothetical protein